MANPNPQHLFEQAERLIEAPVMGAPRQVDIRRAISSAYYGVFHFVLASAADKFIGATKRNTSAYALAYRATDHRSLRDLCDDIRKPALPQKYNAYVPQNGFGPNVVDFARAFVELYERRHMADYDPSVRVKTSDGLLAIRTARAAVARFQGASPARKAAFLTLLVFPPRR